jgi:hypothetical protein
MNLNATEKGLVPLLDPKGISVAATTEKTRKNSTAFSGLVASKKVSATIRKAISKGDASALQATWADELSGPLKHIRKALGESPLLAMWSLETSSLSSRERELAASLNDVSHKTPQQPSKQKTKQKTKKTSASPFEEILNHWMTEGNEPLGAWETVAVAEILLREGSKLSADCFVRVLTRLSQCHSEESLGGLFDATERAERSTDSIEVLMASAEIPWLCGLILSPIQDVQERLDAGRSQLERTLTESTDSEGLVHGSLLKRLPEWLAPITRCTLWSNLFQQELWSDDACVRLAALTERCVMLVQPQQVHHVESDTPEKTLATLREVLDVLLPISGSPFDSRLLKFLRATDEPVSSEVSRPKKMKKVKDTEEEASKESTEASEASERKKKKKKDRETKAKEEKPELILSWESDTSNIAIMRTSMEPDADFALLDWHAGTPEITLAAAGVTLLSGPWTWSLQIDDQPVDLPTTWKCSCWFLDPECIFAEIEGEGSDSIKRVRQLLLAPQERFALITESVTCGDASKKVQLTTTLPMSEGATSEADSITRELSVSVAQRRVRMFPVWMDDDRVLNSPGTFRLNDGRLEQTAIGQGGVTMPLAIDWHPKRTDAPADWARLTVTEARRVLGGHEASGHRVRIGNHQVMIYRSLQSGPNSRAVLGLHTWDETVYTRVPSVGGILQALVEVEAPE